MSFKEKRTLACLVSAIATLCDGEAQEVIDCLEGHLLDEEEAHSITYELDQMKKE